MKRLRLAYRRWCWRRYWAKHTGLLYDAESLGLAPKPPDLHYRGERGSDVAARLRLLMLP